MPLLSVLPGQPDPLGATWDGEGINFAVYSEHAVRVDVCLFDELRGRETARLSLPEKNRHIWHGYVRGIGPGQLYGYRAYGPYAPNEGLRFNPAKLLIDPYARAIAGEVHWSAPVYGHRLGGPREDLTRDIHNSARDVPKSVVVHASFDWRGDRPPNVPWSETVIYEAHVKGLTKLHPDVPPELRGTYAGLASPPVIGHLKSLGVTTLELLPVHHFIYDYFLAEKGLRNYWGYNTIGFFAPHGPYAASGERGQQVAEFKGMVRALHAADIEVVLDVVYNHTAEGNRLGPTLSFRGLENATYYALVPDRPREYQNFTGTGNSFNLSHPQTLKLVMDSLRYWVEEMHVDGFRFDLTVTLGRDPLAFDRSAAFLDAIHQDPVLSRVKLIAEPWDVGDGGYQVGNFPVLWSEWNGHYRDNVRKFWRGDEAQVPDLASHLTGSSYLYAPSGRPPHASINIVTVHDGFTLRDLVSFNDKHNEANLEENMDGTNENESWNCGAEGPTTDPELNALRARQQRNFLATLFLSQGVPLLLGGDEMGRTQLGNNNAYCQDNELSWVHWDLDAEQRALLAYVRRLASLRQAHPVLRRQRFFNGVAPSGANLKDLTWLKLDGTEMAEPDWTNGQSRSLGMRLAGTAIKEVGAGGRPIVDDTLLVLLNAYYDQLPFALPETGTKRRHWQVLLDTADIGPEGEAPRTYTVGDKFPLSGRSLALLRGA